MELLKELQNGFRSAVPDHMILFDEFVKLSMSDDFKEMFLIVIQLGAILAVVVLFFWDIWPFTTPQKGLSKKISFQCGLKLPVACIPGSHTGIMSWR